MSWGYTTEINPTFGVFFTHVWRTAGDIHDVTFFRNVPTVVESLTYADPFGDATAVIRFPQLTGFDGPWANPPTNTVPSDTPWLREFTNVDVFFLPATSTSWHAGEQMVINPITNQRTLYLHTKNQDGTPVLPMWEGFIVSLDPSNEGVSVTCQGALYQLDRYFAKPLYPLRPKTVEQMIARYFDPVRRGLWSTKLTIDFGTAPFTITDDHDVTVRVGADWTKKYTKAERNRLAKAQPLSRMVPTEITAGGTWYDPLLSQTITVPDPPITGFYTRNSGSWEKALTGYIQGQLSILYTETSHGGALMKGDQWTITKDPGRKPRLYVRKQTRTPDLVCWYGQPGVECRMTRDGNQAANVVFGSGRGMDDTSWTTQYVTQTTPWSTWEPLASLKDVRGVNVYHFGDEPLSDPKVPRDTTQTWGESKLVDLYDGYEGWTERTEGIVVAERMAQFPDGIEKGDAQAIADNWLNRDSDPGWSGEITIKVDLRDSGGDPVSKWDIRAGMCILLKGFNGTGATAVQGINKFHISQVQMNPMEGSVSLTVDTKFRDLLTVEEAIAAGRDSLTPIKALQVNKRSVLLDDLVYPWNNSHGSGYFPRSAKLSEVVWTGAFPHTTGTIRTTAAGYTPDDVFLTNHRDIIDGWEYPWVKGELRLDELTKTAYKGKALYVPVHAGAVHRHHRWAFMPMLLSQAGSINRTEFAAYNADGTLCTDIEFCITIYDNWSIGMTSMPVDPDNGQHSALWANAFESRQPNGQIWVNPNDYAPEAESFIIGWGTMDRPGGYSPRMKDGVAQPTGMLEDGAQWSYDFMGRNKDAQVGEQGIGLPIGSGPQVMTPNGISAGVAIYARFVNANGSEITKTGDAGWVYFKGRAYRDLSTRT